MNELLNWIIENEAALLVALGAAWTLVSVCVRLTPSPADDEALSRARATFERISFLQPRDGRGVFSLPTQPAKRQSAPQKRLSGRT